MENLFGHLKEKEIILPFNIKGRTFIVVVFLGTQCTASNLAYWTGRPSKCMQQNSPVITYVSFPLK